MGLDIATCTGLALVGEGEDRGKTVEVQKERGFLRLQLIAANVEQTIIYWQPQVIVIEGYAYAKNVSSFVTLVGIGTIIRTMLYWHKLSWYEVPPASLKKWTTTKGNADKSMMAVSVEKRWGFKSPSHDIIDAYALAQMGQLSQEELLAIPGVIFENSCRFPVDKPFGPVRLLKSVLSIRHSRSEQ